MANREVELKFRLVLEDIDRLEQEILAQGFVPCDASMLQADIYLPSGADDIVRLRTETVGTTTKRLLTKKQPGAGVDGRSTRIETEEEIGPVAYDTLRDYGSRCGALITVGKTRRAYEPKLVTADCGELQITVSLDEVQGVTADGKPSFFMELECLQPGNAEETQIAAVLAYVRQFAKTLLGEREPEKKGYRKMAAEAAAQLAAATT